MKIIDIVHEYPDDGKHFRRGICRVRSFVGPSGVVVVLTDLGSNNDGQSVTNAVELIIDSLLKQGKVISPALFIEHYERSDPGLDEFDRVVDSASGLRWVRMSRADVQTLIDCPLSELDDRSLANKKILSDADRIRFRRNPFSGSPYLEDERTLKRRFEISENMISKREVEILVEFGAGEQDLQRVLKRDLSMFGEAYAHPHDDYICFSEFPLADGVVDFVVLTGTSRMDVILIEVKGADFNLVNSDHYGEFNHKVNEAAGQIRTRLGHLYRDYSKFRKLLHAARKAAESGRDIHNSFLGPHFKLEVSPDKDINIRSVVIGGRTRNDLVESKKRQDFEFGNSPPIRIESWDSWLRRLRRQ